MTDQTQTQTNEDQTPDELTLLKNRAEILGIKHSNNITVETLRKKIEDHLAGQKEEPKEEAPKPSKVSDEMALRAELLAEATKLVRIRIANLDPKKKDIPGEIITVANEYIGTIRKYVTFGEQTDDGYHVPHCIYEFLKERKFLQITQKRDRRTGTNETKTRYVPEFSIEVLPPLTQEELDKLANAQAAAGVFGSDD